MALDEKITAKQLSEIEVQNQGYKIADRTIKTSDMNQGLRNDSKYGQPVGELYDEVVKKIELYDINRKKVDNTLRSGGEGGLTDSDDEGTGSSSPRTP